jgi:hypothetical protein
MGTYELRQRKEPQMAISAIGASPPTHVITPPPHQTTPPPPAQTNNGPDKPNDNDADDNVTSTPPVQSASAPGTGQKVNIIA